MSFAIKLGRSIGSGAAYVGHGILVGAYGAGKFSADVATGVQLGYTERSEELKKLRAEAEAKYQAMLRAEATDATVVAKPEPAPAKTRRVVAKAPA